MAGRKPRQRKVVTEEIVDVEPEVMPQAEFSPDDDLLGTIQEMFGESSDVKLKLSRTSPNGEPVYLQTYPNAEATVLQASEESFIQRRWRGGRYDLRYYRGPHLAYSRSVNIADIDELEPTRNGHHNGQTDVVSILQQQLAMMNQQIIALQSRPVSNSPIGEMVAGAKEIASLAKPAESSNIEKLFDIFMKGMEMGQKSGGDGEFNWKKELMDFAKPAIPAVMGFLQSRNSQAGAPVTVNPGGRGAGLETDVPQPALPGLPPELAAMLTQGFDYLKRKAKAGKNPNVYVDMVLENRDEEIYGTLIDVVCNLEFSQITALDPEIAREPYQSFFRSIYDGIRAEIAAEIEANKQEENLESEPETVLDLGANGDDAASTTEPAKPDSGRPRRNARNAACDGGSSAGRRKG